jgi:hypothetical protein
MSACTHALLTQESISAHPRVHFVWPLLLESVFAHSASADASTKLTWSRFWATVVEKGARFCVVVLWCCGVVVLWFSRQLLL